MSVEGPASALEPGAMNPYKEVLIKTGQQHRPFSVHWELTYRCNEKCSHCYLDVLSPHAPAPGELTTDECLRVIDELAALGVLNLTLSGGEILVRRDLFEIAGYAREKRFLLRLFTNGILITPAVADRIAAEHPYAVEVSLYSTRAEVHEKITRRPRSFELTTRAVRLLRERGVRVVAKTPLMRENVRELGALEQFARELGASFRYDITITPMDSGSLSPLDHRLTDEDLLWLFRETLDADTWSQRVVSPDLPTCNIAKNALLIDPYGTVFPCAQLRRRMGNVREQSIESIWNTSPAWEELSNLTPHTLSVCGTCELRNLCVRCHGLAQLEDGDMRGPASVNCREALMRRQVLVEKGALPADFPIPAHLKAAQAPAPGGAAELIPAESLAIFARPREAVVSD